jgi:hypothetical protein
MNQPSVFISCVSPEFRQTRSRVAAILTRLGYTLVIQEIFGTEPGDLRQVLRDKKNRKANDDSFRHGKRDINQRTKKSWSKIAPGLRCNSPVTTASGFGIVRLLCFGSSSSDPTCAESACPEITPMFERATFGPTSFGHSPDNYSMLPRN